MPCGNNQNLFHTKLNSLELRKHSEIRKKVIPEIRKIRDILIKFNIVHLFHTDNPGKGKNFLDKPYRFHYHEDLMWRVKKWGRCFAVIDG